MQKIRKIWIIIIIGLFGYCFADEPEEQSDFLISLERIGITAEDFGKQSKVSRYDVARILNTLDCEDCLNESPWMQNYYTWGYWTNFLQNPDHYFNDISYLGGIWNKRSYYYCVAYVGDEERSYMRWYPSSSTVFQGSFQGENNTTKAELFQMILNIIQENLWKNYNPRRNEITQRYNNLNHGDYAYRTLSEDSKAIYENTNQRIGISNAKEFQAYLSYCMFNLKDCGFNEISKIKQGAWPISELNVLIREGILDTNDLENIYANVNGQEILRIFNRVFKKYRTCEFNLDYDCDGIINSKDNCAYTYNPSQKDFDNDGKGNVCDDDINNDGKKNPIGIVDDEDNIVITKIPPNFEGKESLFSWNKDNTNNMIFLLQIKDITDTMPHYVKFHIETNQKLRNVHWNFGDGETKDKNTLEETHTYPENKKYRVEIIGTTTEGKMLKASTEFHLWTPENQKYTLNLKTTSKGNQTFLFTPLYNGDFDTVKWIFDFDEKNAQTKKITESFQYTFKEEGKHSIQIIGYKKNEKKAECSKSLIIGTQNTFSSVIINGTSLPEETSFTTNFYGTTKNIVKVIRDRWDGTTTTTETLDKTTTHKYTTRGKKIIKQTIIFNNGEQITNTITLYIDNPYVNQNNAINITASGGTEIFKGDNPITTNISSSGDNTQQQSEYECFKLENTGLINKDTKNTEHNKTENDLCNKYYTNGEIKNFHCDMDKDGIPDICDDDIDGDGKPNLLGIILFEKADCSYDHENIHFPGDTENENNKDKTNNETNRKNNKEGNNGNNTNNNDNNNNNTNQNWNNSNQRNINLNTFLSNFWVCSLDNCSFIANPNQEDLNHNGIGDICEAFMDREALANNNNTNNGWWNNTWENGNNENGGNNGNNGGNNNEWENNNGNNWNNGWENGNTNNWGDNGNNEGNNNEWENNIIFYTETDSDGDGVNDSEDQCPNIPWNKNTTWCPFELGRKRICEHNPEQKCWNGIIEEWETCDTCPDDVGWCILEQNCNACPCHYADYASDLKSDDMIKALLRDKTNILKYTESQRYPFEELLKK